MKIQEDIKLQGLFKIKVFKDGKLIETMEEHNQIVLSAKEAMAHLIGGDISKRSVKKVAFGTNGSIPGVGDTAITSPYEKVIDSVSYPDKGQVTFHFSLGATEANGKKIREFGLLCENGILFARRIRSEILAKEADITITGEWTIIF